MAFPSADFGRLNDRGVKGVYGEESTRGQSRNVPWSVVGNIRGEHPHVEGKPIVTAKRLCGGLLGDRLIKHPDELDRGCHMIEDE